MRGRSPMHAVRPKGGGGVAKLPTVAGVENLRSASSGTMCRRQPCDYQPTARSDPPRAFDFRGPHPELRKHKPPYLRPLVRLRCWPCRSMMPTTAAKERDRTQHTTSFTPASLRAAGTAPPWCVWSLEQVSPDDDSTQSGVSRDGSEAEEDGETVCFARAVLTAGEDWRDICPRVWAKLNPGTADGVTGWFAGTRGA